MFTTGSAWGDISRTLGDLYGGSFTPQIDFGANLKGLDLSGLAGRAGGLKGIIKSNPLDRFNDRSEEGVAKTDEQIKRAEETAKEIGNIDYRKSTFDVDALPDVKDPAKTFADESLRQYELEVGLTKEFEKDLIQKSKDQALIDTAVDDVAVQQRLSQGIVDRSRSRYGIDTTGAFNLEQRRATERARVNIASDALNTARISQDETNTALLNALSNIANDVNKTNLNMGASAAQNFTQMENSFKSARAQHKSNKYGIIGSFIGAL